MTIIASTDQSDYGIGKPTNKSITLAEQFGMYLIIRVEYRSGWCGWRNAEIIDTFTKYNKAVDCYIKHGGQMRMEF